MPADEVAELSAIIGERTVLVDANEARIFEKDALVAAVRDYEALRHRGWLEAFVSSYLAATRRDLWWVSGAGGWDYLLREEPSAELRAKATDVVRWRANGEKPVAGPPLQFYGDSITQGDSDTSYEVEPAEEKGKKSNG